jgi:hypothetical protein
MCSSRSSFRIRSVLREASPLGPTAPLIPYSFEASEDRKLSCLAGTCSSCLYIKASGLRAGIVVGKPRAGLPVRDEIW